MHCKKDWDTAGNALRLTDTSDSRTHIVMTGALGYNEVEWRAFQYG